MSARIDVTAKPGLVLLEVAVGPLSVQVSIRPRDADTLAGAFQRAAIEANAPKLALVRPVDVDLRDPPAAGWPLPESPTAANE